MADDIKNREGNVIEDGFLEVGDFIIGRGAFGNSTALPNQGTPAEQIAIRHIINDMLAAIVFQGCKIAVLCNKSIKYLIQLMMTKNCMDRLRYLRSFIETGDINNISTYSVKRAYLPERGFETLLNCDMYSNKASERNKAEWQRAYVDTISTK